MRNEFAANEYMNDAVAERARWTAVLAPTGRTARRVTRKPGMLARIAAFFA